MSHRGRHPSAKPTPLPCSTRFVAPAILGPVRGMPAVDRDVLSGALLGLARLAEDHDEIAAIDVNPMIVVGSRPVAADALVVLGPVKRAVASTHITQNGKGSER